MASVPNQSKQILESRHAMCARAPVHETNGLWPRGEARLMTKSAEATPPPSVLVIAANDNIEALAGELVAFAGYRPSFDATNGAAGESIRRTRPDVALLDTALPPDVVRSCVDAADEGRSRGGLLAGNGRTYGAEI